MKRTEGQCEADTRRYREDQESTVKRVILQVKDKKPSNHEKTRSKISSSTEEHDNSNLPRSFDSARRVSMISTKNVVKTIMKPRASFFKLLNMNLVRSRLYQQHSKQNSGSFTLQHKDAKQYTLIHCINFVKHTSNISNILERNFMTFKQFSRTISRYSTTHPPIHPRPRIVFQSCPDFILLLRLDSLF